ncbi:ABC transporter substrate-binding protein [Brevibacillus fluminis]|uniref:ABC transporter substrate-binding protein n=1 Tax=Brevibacillus fluminis TaxID=511487 RepID=A0A3M8D5Y6_9BACL|nr:ABC transporter substrate-binding protein [Brevibacillus fluminis]
MGGVNVRKRFGLPKVLSSVAVLSMLALAGCGGGQSAPAPDAGSATQSNQQAAQPSGQPKDGGILTLALSANAKTLDPIKYTAVYESNVMRNIADTLVVYNQDLSKLEPSLATEWKVSDDMKVYTFKLRDNVFFQPGKFQDGRKMTAEDVKYSLERSAQHSAMNRLRGVEKVEVTGPNEVALHLTAPNAAVLAALTDVGNVIVPKEEVEGWGDDFGKHLVGTGPFQLESWANDGDVKVKRFDKYWGEKPHLDGITFKFITDGNMMTNALRSGDIDIATDIKGQNRAIVQKDDKLSLLTTPGLSISYLGMNMKEGPTKDVKVREAMAMGTDVQGLIKAVYQWGGAEPSKLPLPKGSWGYDASAEANVPKYDPAKAKQLLTEAGYPNGFNTEIYVAQSRVPEATIFATQMKEHLGINVEIKTVEWGTFSDIVSKGKAPLYIAGWTWYPDPDFFLFQMFHSKQIGALGNGYGFNNPKVDELLDRATSETTDEAKRKELYSQALKLIVDERPRIELGLIEIVAGTQKHVQGFNVKADNSIVIAGNGVNVWLDK